MSDSGESLYVEAVFTQALQQTATSSHYPHREFRRNLTGAQSQHQSTEHQLRWGSMRYALKLERTIEQIEDNQRECRLLEYVADPFRVDCGNLDRAFRNKHVKRFIDDQRKKYLIRLVANNNRYGYEIANQIGIANDHAFYRWVKKQFGVSYAKLRERIRSGES